MLQARKDNKVYTIDEYNQDYYLNDGYDIYEDDVLKIHSPKKTIKYSEHEKVIKELMGESVVDLLKGYAKLKSIDLGESTTAEGMVKKIVAYEQ